MNKEGSCKWNITASHTRKFFLEQKQNQELPDVLFIAPRKPLLYSGENKTLLGHTQPLAIGTIFTLVSTQEFASPNLLLYPRIILLGLKVFPLDVAGTKLALGSFHPALCVFLLGRESCHFKGAADTQGVSRNKNLTLCLCPFHLSVSRASFPSVQTDPCNSCSLSCCYRDWHHFCDFMQKSAFVQRSCCEVHV